MKVSVNEDCISCGMCINICPQVFDYDADGLSHVIGDADNYVDKVRKSAEVCPVNAIEID